MADPVTAADVGISTISLAVQLLDGCFRDLLSFHDAEQPLLGHIIDHMLMGYSLSIFCCSG